MRLDGSSNLKELRAEALKVALSRLKVPVHLRGASILEASFRPVNVNGVVSSVSWSSDGLTCHTAVRAGPGDEGSGVSSLRLERIYRDPSLVTSERHIPPGWRVPSLADKRAAEEGRSGRRLASYRRRANP